MCGYADKKSTSPPKRVWTKKFKEVSFAAESGDPGGLILGTKVAVGAVSPLPVFVAVTGDGVALSEVAVSPLPVFSAEMGDRVLLAGAGEGLPSEGKQTVWGSQYKMSKRGESAVISGTPRHGLITDPPSTPVQSMKLAKVV